MQKDRKTLVWALSALLLVRLAGDSLSRSLDAQPRRARPTAQNPVLRPMVPPRFPS
jgi:hypothetical protein